MNAAQILAREIAGLMVSLEHRLGPGDVTDAARAEYDRAARAVTALGALMGIAPTVTVTAADVRPRPRGDQDRCPNCGEKLRLVPTAGFGTVSRDICGACGHEPASAA